MQLELIQLIDNKRAKINTLKRMSYNKNYRSDQNNSFGAHNRNSRNQNYTPFGNKERQRSRDDHQEGRKPYGQQGGRNTVRHYPEKFNQKESRQYLTSERMIRSVPSIEIGNPTVYLVWKWPKESLSHFNIDNPAIIFKQSVAKFNTPPKKIQPQSSKISVLKDRITPVQQLWGQIIKQFLNDSQFVQIYRKRNSLAYGAVQYGKTMIKYDGMQHKSFYDNRESQENVFSRAYFKLWEILSLGILDKKKEQDITIANLAEGPGGFIHALIDFRLKQNKTLQDRYFAITLKIQEGKTRMAKDWSDFRGERFFEKMRSEGYKIKLSYGQTGDGNLYKIQNIESFKTHVMEGREAFLVTGDGGIQCIGDDEFHYQEIFNSKLFFSQILTALKIQEVGGVFVLKIYDMHFAITQQLIMLLCLYYRKVGVVKPLTSRPGNSEKYLLCEGFFGITQGDIIQLTELLRKWHNTEKELGYFDNKEFVHSILEFTKHENLKFTQTIAQRLKLINCQISQEQEKKLSEGLDLIQRHNGDKQSILREVNESRYEYQMGYAYEWCRKYGLTTIDVKVERREEKPIKE